jgi:hypothetical protein
MQQFDAWGKLQETIDFSSVGFLTSRLRKDIRSFTREGNPSPNLIMARETIRAAQDEAPGMDGHEARLAGAAAWEMDHRCRAIKSNGATFWTGGRYWKGTRNGEGMYSITDNPTSGTQWLWTKGTQVNIPTNLVFYRQRKY